MPQARTRLRPFDVDDLAAVLPIEQELFSRDPPWSEDVFRSELARVPDTRWYVVAIEETSGEVVGYVGLMHSGHTGDTADVQTIAVTPARQRLGIGTLLMTALIAEARRRAAGTVTLDVRADNEPAQAMYRAFGFEEVRRRRRYYADGTDGVVMSLTL